MKEKNIVFKIFLFEFITLLEIDNTEQIKYVYM